MALTKSVKVRAADQQLSRDAGHPAEGQLSISAAEISQWAEVHFNMADDDNWVLEVFGSSSGFDRTTSLAKEYVSGADMSNPVSTRGFTRSIYKDIEEHDEDFLEDEEHEAADRQLGSL